jgi:hypothetical protein
VVLYAISIHIRPELKQYQATNLVETNTLKAKHVIFPAGTQRHLNIETTFDTASHRLYYRHFNIETTFETNVIRSPPDVVFPSFQH